MAKLIIIAAFVLLQAAVTLAQEAPKTPKDTTRPTAITQAPVKMKATTLKAPTGSTNPPPAPVNFRDYYLTNAKATIYTGNDNKEQPSQVQMQMVFGSEGVANYMVPQRDYREFAVNSVTELPFKCYYPHYYNYENIMGYAQNGGRFLIYYSPNFPLDAWKIDKVVITLEFRDDNGNLLPTFGTKNIVFANINALMNDSHRTLRCEVDQFLMPKGVQVLK